MKTVLFLYRVHQLTMIASQSYMLTFFPVRLKLIKELAFSSVTTVTLIIGRAFYYRFIRKIIDIPNTYDLF